MTTLDLRRDLCPMTWVKTRIALDPLAPGDALALLVREGEPLDSVPRAAELEGHAIRERAPAPDAGAGCWRVVIVKGAPRREELLP